MNRRAFGALILLAGTLASGCGPKRAGTGQSPERQLLTRAELDTRKSDNMYVVVSAMRPHWMTTPLGSAGVSYSSPQRGATVYLDGRELGGLELLRTISVESVERARYLTTSEAQGKFGLKAATPVIDITSRGRAP
jgi:hypothetical protein